MTNILYLETHVTMVFGPGYFAVIAVLLVPSTAFNGVLLHLISTKRNLQSVPNKYIATVIRANLTAGLCVCMSVFIIMFLEEVAHNSLFCFGMYFLDRSLLAVATSSMVALSFDRYKFFVKQNNVTFSLTTRIIVIVWIVSFGYGLGCLSSVFFIEQASVVYGQIEGMCSMKNYHKLTNMVLHTIDFIGICLVPTVFMTIMYFKVVQKLWFMPSANLIQLKTNQKSILLNIAISVVHMIIWVPMSLFQIAHVAVYPETESRVVKIVQFVSLFCRCLRFLVLPIIYFSVSKQARHELSTCGVNQVGQYPHPRRRMTAEELDMDGYLQDGAGTVSGGQTIAKKTSDNILI